jgi:hypothetical protein
MTRARKICFVLPLCPVKFKVFSISDGDLEMKVLMGAVHSRVD